LALVPDYYPAAVKLAGYYRIEGRLLDSFDLLSSGEVIAPYYRNRLINKIWLLGLSCDLRPYVFDSYNSHYSELDNLDDKTRAYIYLAKA